LQYLPELRRRFRLRARFQEAAGWKLSMAAAKMDQRRGGGPPGDLGSDQITWVSVHVRRCEFSKIYDVSRGFQTRTFKVNHPTTW
jgi:hypothetical protein